ncbi:DUF2961 domain-containing protein [Nocardia sp. GCM10030253]|uniref:DUF2961 domain-containing protein n=1 Tax=Nocardia sp. GCM10030253 TaxID=3273404 RepID=UPI00362DF7F1
MRDERVYIDDSSSPQLYGTGTEDFYEGGWFFRHGTRYSLPLTGQPSVRTTDDRCPDYCASAYRLMLAEAVDYRSGLRFGIEHGTENEEQAEYGSVAFLYTQTTTETMARGDDVDVPDPVDSAEPESTEYPLTGRYEGDLDDIGISAHVLATRHPITVRLPIRPDNIGVLLRRTSDQAIGYQSAAVLVDGEPVGTWLQPRQNPVRQWLDDTYPLPRRVTAGKDVISVTFVPTAGAPPWTAARYRADTLHH